MAARLQQRLQRGFNHKDKINRPKESHCADSAPVGGLDFLENAAGFLIQIKLSAN
jgi:hypothetical protein